MAYSSLLSLSMSFLILLSNIFFVGLIFVYLVSPVWREKIRTHVYTYAVEYIFVLSLLATVGSLTLSDVVGFNPCELCWFQRIFMYPQVFVSFIAIIRKEKNIVYYLLPLTIIGSLIALYHSFILWGGKSILPCTQAGSACAKIYVLDFHYITIPAMSLSIFVYLLAVSLVYLKVAKKVQSAKDNK